MLAAFAGGGVHRGDLVALVAPRDEQESFHRRLRSQGVSLDLYIARDEGIVLDAEDYAPREGCGEPRIAALFEDLEGLVSARGRSGLSLVDRLAPTLFEVGDLARAERAEQLVRSEQATARVLCPYEADRVSLRDMAGASSLFRAHSHTISTFGGDRFLVETVGDRHRN